MSKSTTNPTTKSDITAAVEAAVKREIKKARFETDVEIPDDTIIELVRGRLGDMKADLVALLGATSTPGPAGQPPTDFEIPDEAVHEVVRKMPELAELESRIRTKVQEAMKAAGVIKTVVEIKVGDKPKVDMGDAVLPEWFERAMKLAVARKNILLIGPTGCGKTHGAELLAKALKLSFAFVSCSAGMSEGHLAGRLLPVGKAGTFEYVIAEFVKAFENGGVFLLDEIDSASPEVLLTINAALANGKMPLSNRPEKPYAIRHKDFICIAAANTYGTGADRMYVGRTQLDDATLDRFRIGQIKIDYDPKVERSLCPDAALLKRLLEIRDAARAAKLRRNVSTRFIRDAYEMKSGPAGWTIREIEEALFCGWTEDELAKVQ